MLAFSLLLQDLDELRVVLHQPHVKGQAFVYFGAPQHHIDVGAEAHFLEVVLELLVVLHACDHLIVIAIEELFEEAVKGDEVVVVDVIVAHLLPDGLVLRLHESGVDDADFNLGGRGTVGQL